MEDQLASYAATQHLIGLGHKRIAFLSGPQAAPWSHERFEGYRRALREAGMDVDDRLVFQAGTTVEDGAKTAMQIVNESCDATAVQATSDDQVQLAKQVDDYNDPLHRIQDALRHYAVVHQKSADSKTQAKDLKMLVEQENKLFDEVGQLTKHAENVQDAIRANSNYAVLYMEGSICAARKDIPTKLLDLDLDKLKFIDKAP